jgi:hypothetical protein
MTAPTTTAESFSAASLDFDTLLGLSRRTDPVGVCPSTLTQGGAPDCARQRSTLGTGWPNWSSE